MNRKEKVIKLLRTYGIDSLSIVEGQEDAEFKMSGCDSCGEAGNQYECVGFQPGTKEVLSGFSVCSTCLVGLFNDEWLDDSDDD